MRARPVGLQWAILFGLSAALTLVLELVHLPAALLLGPMIAAIVIAALEGTVRVPALPFSLAQGIIGLLIARSIPVSVFAEIGKDWPVFAGGVVFVIAAASVLGYVLARFQVLPGSTAVWGSSPGAATAMVLMAEASGADVRLVAIMQYLRVVCVAAVASLVAKIWSPGANIARPAIVWFPHVDERQFILTLLVAVGGALAGPRLGILAGSLILPLVAGVVAQDFGHLTITLPPWLLAMSYTLVGWTIGLRFTRDILVYAARSLPRVLASIFGLVGVCAAFAGLLAWKAGIDPLTAYLATSPGGADSVAIIAASTKVDVPFVMTMQTARFVIVLLIGPALSGFIAKHTPTPASGPR